MFIFVEIVSGVFFPINSLFGLKSVFCNTGKLNFSHYLMYKFLPFSFMELHRTDESTIHEFFHDIRSLLFIELLYHNGQIR